MGAGTERAGREGDVPAAVSMGCDLRDEALDGEPDLLRRTVGRDDTVGGVVLRALPREGRLGIGLEAEERVVRHGESACYQVAPVMPARNLRPGPYARHGLEGARR